VAAHIASTCTALTSLSLAGIPTVKDADVRTVCRAAGGLEHVDLTGCCGLGDHAVQALSGLRSLRWLSLARCWQVRGVGPLQHCPELRSLNLGGCWQVGDTELGDLLSGLHHLEELQVWGRNYLPPHARPIRPHGTCRCFGTSAATRPEAT